jgi:hypothetical protein
MQDLYRIQVEFTEYFEALIDEDQTILQHILKIKLDVIQAKQKNQESIKCKSIDQIKSEMNASICSESEGSDFRQDSDNTPKSKLATAKTESVGRKLKLSKSLIVTDSLKVSEKDFLLNVHGPPLKDDKTTL